MVDKELDAKLYIRYADIICGMSSMFLIESAISQKKILSIQIGLKRDNPLVLEKMNVLKTIRTKEDLEIQLDNALKGKIMNCTMDFKENAVNNILKAIEKGDESNGYTSN